MTDGPQGYPPAPPDPAAPRRRRVRRPGGEPSGPLQQLLDDMTVERNRRVPELPRPADPRVTSRANERDLRRLIGLLNDACNSEGDDQ